MAGKLVGIMGGGVGVRAPRPPSPLSPPPQKNSPFHCSVLLLMVHGHLGRQILTSPPSPLMMKDGSPR